MRSCIRSGLAVLLFGWLLAAATVGSTAPVPGFSSLANGSYPGVMPFTAAQRSGAKATALPAAYELAASDTSPRVAAAADNFMATLARLPESTPLRIFVAFLVTALLIPWTLELAANRGLVDRPGGRKQHEIATPVTGGLVLMLAMLIASAAFGDFGSRAMYGFFIAGGVMVAAGFIDDLVGLGWKAHVLVQVTAALLMIFVGGVVIDQLSDVFGVPDAFLGAFAIPFTVLVVIGVVNALNMIDGSDGLAAGQALVSLGLFAAFALYAGNAGAAGRLLMICAAIAGFMLWNLRHPWQPRARVFLGNAGSLLLGFIIAWTAVRLTQNPAHPISPVLGPWTIALPLIDCVTLMIRRWRQGRSPFRADRDHLHHMLLDAGYSPARIALGMMGVSLLLGLVAAAALKLGVPRPLLVVAFLLLWAGYYWLTARRDRAVAFFHRFHGVHRVAPIA